MAVQNMYNNYLKRQNQSPTNQFRQKIANSLSGKPVANTATQSKTPNMMGNNSTNLLGNGTQNKTKQNVARTVSPMTTQTTQQTTPQASTTLPNTTQPVQQPINQIQPQNALESNIQAQTPISEQQITNPEQIPIINQETNGAIGMMSLSDIDNAINGTQQNAQQPSEQIPQTQEQSSLLDEGDYEAIFNMAQSPYVARMARSADKSPQQMAQELVEEQKKALQAQWEQKKQELELQKNQLEESYKTSKDEAENTYKESESKLQENRYNQQEDLAVSGQKRGIQYSPQQLALENVANINLNKNLAEASKNRNQLLNQLAIQLSQSLANVNMGLQSATVDYNKNVSDLMANYQQQMIDWAYQKQEKEDDRAWQTQQTESDRAWQEKQTQDDRTWQEKLKDEERKWQESQTQADREWQQSQTEADRNWQSNQTKEQQEFEKLMAELQNKWQSGENALDRETYGRSSGSSYSGYSGYGGYSRSYTPYSSYARSGYSNYSDDLDLSSDLGETAYGETFKQYSTDLYNSLNVGGVGDVNERAKLYINDIDEKIAYAKANGMSSKAINELEKTRQTATKHLYNNAYAKSTNTPIKIGDTYYKSSTPVKQSYAQQVVKDRILNASKYNSIVGKTSLERNASSNLAKTIEQAQKKTTTSKTNTTKKTTTDTKKKVATTATKKATTTTKKTSTASKVQATTNKNATTSKAKTQTALKNSLSNLKKNIANLFSKKKK